MKRGIIHIPPWLLTGLIIAVLVVVLVFTVSFGVEGKGLVPSFFKGIGELLGQVRP